MDILAIRRRTVSTVICDVNLEENGMLRSIVNFCFSVEECISIDYTSSDKSTKRGRPKCRNAPRRGGEGGRD